LLSAKLPNTTINGAESIPAGTYQPPGSATAFTGLPAFCRVTATVGPVPGSSIGIEVWLPATTWNGKYQQSGSHGFGGTFYWNEMVPQIQRGYATGITNDGHGGPGGFNVSWAFGDPEAITDALRAMLISTAAPTEAGRG
jgi:feruloyl esterase